MLADLLQLDYPLALVSQTYRLLLLRINRPAPIKFALWVLKLRDSLL